MYEQTVRFDRMEHAVALFGNFDENIRLIQSEFNVDVISRGSDIKVTGNAEDVANAVKALNTMLTMLNKGEPLNDQNVRYCVSMVRDGTSDRMETLLRECVCITSRGKPVKPKTIGQSRYCEAIEKNTITVGIGPAGTGKTYLAVAMAVAAFRAGTVNRIILTRPAVEAGEKLGFLPGDLQSKVDPYLRPLYDALFDMLGSETFQKYQDGRLRPCGCRGRRGDCNCPHRRRQQALPRRRAFRRRRPRHGRRHMHRPHGQPLQRRGKRL